MLGSGGMVEGAAFLLPSGVGAVFQTPAVSRSIDQPTVAASWLPAVSDPVWTPGVPLTPLAVWPRPDLTADTIDDLLIGKPASDPLVGDPFDSGNAGAGAETAAPATSYPAALDAILAGGWQAAARLPFGQTLAPRRVTAPAADAVIGDDYFLPGGDGSDGARRQRFAGMRRPVGPAQPTWPIAGPNGWSRKSHLELKSGEFCSTWRGGTIIVAV